VQTARRTTGEKEVRQMSLKKLTVPRGYVLIFRPYITRKDGSRLYAASIGKRAFPLLVPIAK
jgi:hypothetical protein